MRTYEVNDKGDRRYILGCTDLDCICSGKSEIVLVWKKGEYKHDEVCGNCGSVLTETMHNWTDMPKFNHEKTTP